MKRAFTVTSLLAAAMLLGGASTLAIAAPEKAKSAAHSGKKDAKHAKPESGKEKSASKKDEKKADAKKAGKSKSAEKSKAAEKAKHAETDKPQKPTAKDAKAKGGKPAAHAEASAAKAHRVTVVKDESRVSAAVPFPRVRPSAVARMDASVRAEAPPMPTSARQGTPMMLASAVDVPIPEAQTGALAYAPSAPPTSSDVDTVKEALALIRKGRISDATEREQNVRNAAARTLIEWALLRSDNSDVGFARYAQFLQAHADWPSQTMLRRRAEAQLCQEKRDPATVLAFFRSGKPVSARGRLAFARALLTQGDRAGAQFYAREAWRNDDMSSDLESQALELFGDLLTRADHKARMDQRLYDGDNEDGLRAAQRLGGYEVAIARARAAVTARSHNAAALLEAVPNEARSDPGYIFSRAQWARRNDRIGEAAQLMLSAPHDASRVHDPDEWWTERRIIVRKLLDGEYPQAAYRVARDAAVPN
jgi:soluble lytic murein transglycosylase